jgi:putative tryptophan/tyrosine transport system substrate-binding protein
MRGRREFLTLLGGTALAWQFAGTAQPLGQLRRVGVLLNLSEDDPETRARLGVFLEELEKLGWREGRNLRLDYRWSLGETERIRKKRH